MNMAKLILLISSVALVLGIIPLANAADFNISTTANFDAGTKSSTETITNSYNASENTLQLSSPPYAKDANLVAFWPMDEGAGLVNDSTLVNNCTGTGPDWNSTGKFGSAKTFIAANADYLDCGTGASLNLQNNLTYSAWVYIDPYNAQRTLMTKGTAASSDSHQYIMYAPSSNNGGDKFEVFAGPSSYYVQGNTNLTPNQWQFLVFTRSGNNATLWLDTAVDKTATFGTPISVSTSFVIGRHSAMARYYNGTADNIRIYNRTLSAAEITTLYNSGNKFTSSGNWISASQTLLSGSMSNTTITYSNVDTYTNISKIEWLVGGVVKATYGTAITSGTSATIVNANLTSGTFSDVNSTFTVKVYFNGNGTATPIISQINGYYAVSTCTYPGTGNWAITCSDNCAFSSTQQIDGNVTLSGSGTVTFNAGGKWIFNSSNQFVNVGSGCQINVFSGGGWNT